MKIYLYRINLRPKSKSVEAVLAEINALELSQRNQEHNGEKLRLEHFEERGGLIYADFVKLRFDHGPGRVGENEAITGFDLEDNEGFGEETALVYCPATGYAAIQYNHYGPRHALIEDYLRLMGGSAFDAEILPKYDEELQNKVRSMTLYRKLELSICPRNLTESDYRRGVPLKEAIELSKNSGADNVEITLSVGRGRNSHLTNRTIKRIIDWVMGRVNTGNHDGVLTKCKLTARKDEAESSELLDLLAQRIMLEREVIAGPDRRFPRQNRYNALEISYRSWEANLDLGG